jgi:hypothetical protein
MDHQEHRLPILIPMVPPGLQCLQHPVLAILMVLPEPLLLELETAMVPQEPLQ